MNWGVSKDWRPWCLLVAVVSTTAQARFLDSDADQIDPEERLSTETYNDKISYRFPTVWDRLWNKRDAGYRISAGSLNISRFNIEEQIKFSSDQTKEISFSFHQDRQEDVVESRTEQVIRIDWMPPWLIGVNLGLFAEGGTNKQYGDIGTAVGFKPTPQQNVEFYYWSTDHYYDAKKAYPDDSRSRQTFTTGIRSDWTFSPQLRFQFDYQFDKPLTWDRQSRDYQYDYWRRTTELRLEMGNESSIAGYVSAFQEIKEEGKVFTAGESLTYEKTLSRNVDIYETAVYQTSGTTVVTTGVQVIQRDATYTFSADDGVEESDYKEDPGPDDSERRELGYFGTVYMGSGLDTGLQFGAFINQVEIDEAGSEFRETEIKAQTAWDFLLTTESRIMCNLTWDLDQLQKDWPYTDSGFKPWGGGNIQFLAVF